VYKGRSVAASSNLSASAILAGGNMHFTDILFYVPMTFMSLAGITLVIWRILLNINGNTNMNEFLPAFQQKLEKEGVQAALSYCRQRQDIIPRRLYVAGLEVSKQGIAASRRAMANAIELEILPDLNFLLPSILAIAKVATMVGLLGTVISMIRTFNAIQKASGGDVASSSGAIGLALIATALGLITAIPLSFAHVLFKAWVAKFETRMKSAAQKLILLLQAKPPQGKSVPPPPPGSARPGTDSAASVGVKR
jgi:biopolymer transport protein ExbB